MHARRPSAIPTLAIVLPHPPLPRRLSFRSSLPSPHTPRNCDTPLFFKLDSIPARTSTDSWNSSNQDGLDDELEWEWKPDQISFLIRTLDALPAHLLTPFNGPVPPSNLLDKLARGVAQAKGPLEWPHSTRATRAKLVELARRRGKKEQPHLSQQERRKAMELEVLHQSTNTRTAAVRPLYRQSSMDFMQNANLDIKGRGSTIGRLSSRLQRADRFIPNPTYHPYARPGSRSPSPLDVRPGSFPPSLHSSSASSTSLNSRNALRRSVTESSSNMRGRLSDSFTAGVGFSNPSLKRAPSFGAVSSHSSRMSIDLLGYPSSDEEEKVRTRKAKKPRTRSDSPSANSGSDTSLAKASSKSGSTTACSSSSGTTLASSKSKLAPKVKRNLQRNPSMFGADLFSSMGPIATPLHAAPTFATKIVQIPPITPQVQPPRTRTLRRVKATAFSNSSGSSVLRPPSRRISFGSLVAPTEEDGPGPGCGVGLGSAFQLH